MKVDFKVEGLDSGAKDKIKRLRVEIKVCFDWKAKDQRVEMEYLGINNGFCRTPG